MKVTLLIFTINEELGMTKIMPQIDRSLIDQIIICDGGSTDKTCEIAKTKYGVDFTSIICKENIFGTQFHPEKSSKAGRKFLQNFLHAKN